MSLSTELKTFEESLSTFVGIFPKVPALGIQIRNL